MKFSRRQVARYAAKLLHDKTPIREVAQLLAAYIIEAKAKRSTELLVNEVKRFLAEEYDHVSISVTSVTSLNAELLREVKAIVGSPKHLEVREEINPEIIGGIIINMPGKEFDGSIQARINKLKAIGS